MKPSRLILFVIIPLLTSCFPKKPEISLPAIPAHPLIEALEQRRQAFAGLTALASVTTVKAGSRRAYDTVGIVIDGQRRLRVEVYGPLGQSLMTLVWDGAEALLRLEDGRIVRPGRAGLERLLGVTMDAGELCAVLTGNIPAETSAFAASAFRNVDGSDLVVLDKGKTQYRFSVFSPDLGSEQPVRIVAAELYRSDRLVYRIRYEGPEQALHYMIARTVNIEIPEQKTLLAVVYGDVEINAPLPADAFVLSAGETEEKRP